MILSYHLLVQELSRETCEHPVTEIFVNIANILTSCNYGQSIID